MFKDIECRTALRHISVMPHGTRHEFTGLLTADDAELILRLPDQREWLLRADDAVKRFIGANVRVVGMRGGGNVLHVESVHGVALEPGLA